MTYELNNTSTEAVAKATGKGWNEWLTILDEAGADNWDHKHIVTFLAQHYGDSVNDWWQQHVTVGYEKARGLRELGQTADAGYQIGVQKTLPISADALWIFLISPEGLRLWLDGTSRLILESKQPFTSPNGISGEVRTIDPGKKLRLTWKRPDWELTTTLQLYLVPAGTATTSLRFHHEKLASQAQRQEMKGYWQGVLSDIAEKVSA